MTTPTSDQANEPDLAALPDHDDYTVRLDRVFSGPMDLLLHLVREHEVEIHEIEIHRIVSDYLAYLKAITDLDIEAAADFVLMAATLMAIKSRSLLPTEELDLEEELDPRDELILRLVEYRRFRSAAEDLEHRWADRGLLCARGWRGEVAAGREEPEYDLRDLTAFDLLAHWSRLQREVASNRPHHVRSDPRPIRYFVERVVEHLRRVRGQGGALSVRGLVEGGAIDGPEREVLIGSFCAVLELAKLGVVHLEQEDLRADIGLRLEGLDDEEIERILSETTFEVADPETLAEAELAAEHELGRVERESEEQPPAVPEEPGDSCPGSGTPVPGH